MAETPWTRESLEEVARRNARALVELVLEQGRLIAQQRAAIEALERRVSELEEALRQSGGGGGGAAPFRVPPDKRKETPKPPGGRPGHEGHFRVAPAQVDEIIEVPLAQCPECGEPVGWSKALEQTVVELPAVRPRVVRLRTHRGCCARCGTVVQSTHPLQVSRAAGALAGALGRTPPGLYRGRGLASEDHGSVAQGNDLEPERGAGDRSGGGDLSRRALEPGAAADFDPSSDGREEAHGRQDAAGLPGYAYQALVTSLPSSVAPIDVWRDSNGRAGMENVIKELVHGFGLPKLCCQSFWATEAALSLVVLTYNLSVLFARHLGWLEKVTIGTLRYRLFMTAGILSHAQGGTLIKLGIPLPNRPWWRRLWEKLLCEFPNCNAVAQTP